MDPNVQPPSPHGTAFLRVISLLVFALLIAVLSSLGTYLYLSNQLRQQNTQSTYPSAAIKQLTTTTSQEQIKEFGCNTDSDCAVKTTGGICASLNCVNKDFVQTPITPQQGVYNCPMIHLKIDGCKCINQTCIIVQN